jgi:hypothetical protein
MWFRHLYTVSQAAQSWGCSEEMVLALVAKGTIPTHRAFLGMFGPICLDGSYVDLVAPDARALNKHFDEIMGGPGWQERKKQEREQTEREIERIKACTEEIRKEGERQQQVFHQQLSEMMEQHAQSLFQQISEHTERSMQEVKKNEK